MNNCGVTLIMKKCLGLSLLILSIFLNACDRSIRSKYHDLHNTNESKPMIVEVETSSPNTNVIIPIVSVNEYSEHICMNSYFVECVGGKQINTDIINAIHCFFKSPGKYLIKIHGQLHGIRLVDHDFRSGYDEQYYFTDIKQWGDIPWHDLSYFADNCKKLAISASDVPNFQGLVSMERMFSNTNINCNLNDWDVSHVKNMSGLFLGNEVFNQPLDKWDTSNVINMRGMFYFAKSFNQHINSWNVSGVKDMSEMFLSANAFNQSLSSWDVSNVHFMNKMFFGANSFHQNLSDWNYTGIEECLGDVEYFGDFCIDYMFSYSNNDPSHLIEYGWMQHRFQTSVLCNIDVSDCSFNGM